MNSDSNSKDLSPAEDRLTDALIAEHARLGSGNDDDLVANILLKTVNRPIDIVQLSPAEKPSFGFGDWAKVAAVVAVIVSVVALGLNKLESGPQVVKKNVRTEETFHLVVNYVEPDKGEVIEQKDNHKILVSAVPGMKKFAPVIDDPAAKAPEFSLSGLDLLPPTTEFGRSIDELPKVSIVSSTFKLASNDTTTSGSKVIYSGDVELSHTGFVLHADSLVIDRSGYVGDVPVLKALNAVLTHRAGAYEAEADAISFDPSSGELVAHGIQRLVSRGHEQPVVNQAATIVFEADTFFIKEVF